MSDLPVHDAEHVRLAMVEIGYRALTPIQRVIAIDRILRAAYKYDVPTLAFIATLVEGK